MTFDSYFAYCVFCKASYMTRNSSEDEIANVNFLYDDIVYTRTTKYNRLVHKFRQRLTRLCVGTQVYQSQWNNAMQRPYSHSHWRCVLANSFLQTTIARISARNTTSSSYRRSPNTRQYETAAKQSAIYCFVLHGPGRNFDLKQFSPM